MTTLEPELDEQGRVVILCPCCGRKQAAPTAAIGAADGTALLCDACCARHRVWLKWSLHLAFSTLLAAPFIAFGPVALVFALCGADFAGAFRNVPGSSLCCLFSLLCVDNWIALVRLPWRGGGRDLPVYWQGHPPWAGDREAIGDDECHWPSSGSARRSC
jgi:hypothetical protein